MEIKKEQVENYLIRKAILNFQLESQANFKNGVLHGSIKKYYCLLILLNLKNVGRQILLMVALMKKYFHNGKMVIYLRLFYLYKWRAR